MKLSLSSALLLLPLRQTQGFAAMSTRQARKRSTMAPASQMMNLGGGLFESGRCTRTQSSYDCEDGDAQGNNFVNNRHSASDWFYNIKSIPQSKVLREIRNPVIAVACWSFVVSAFQRLLFRSSSPLFKAVATKMCIPGTAHGFLVSALGLLLVFRTNSSYQRFYEGRKIWENILNLSRNLSRMISLYSKEVGKKRERRMLDLLSSFPYLLRHHIRPGCLCESPDAISPAHRLVMKEPAVAPVDTRFEGDKALRVGRPPMTEKDCFVDRQKLPWSLFENESLAKLSRAKNRPLWVCDRLGKEIMSIEYGPNYTSRERLTMLGLVGKLTDALGKCERIHQTAVPLNYARHSLRSLTLWLFTLPFALVKDMGLLTAPVAASVAWLLYGIYQIGYSIEDPFQGSLRLSILCDAIRRDVMGGNSLEDQHRISAYSEEEDWEEDKAGAEYEQSDLLVPPMSNSSIDTFLRDPASVDHPSLHHSPLLMEQQSKTIRVSNLARNR